MQTHTGVNIYKNGKLSDYYSLEELDRILSKQYIDDAAKRMETFLKKRIKLINEVIYYSTEPTDC
jgi:hypothetical protein